MPERISITEIQMRLANGIEISQEISKKELQDRRHSDILRLIVSMIKTLGLENQVREILNRSR